MIELLETKHQMAKKLHNTRCKLSIDGEIICGCSGYGDTEQESIMDMLAIVNEMIRERGKLLAFQRDDGSIFRIFGRTLYWHTYSDMIAMRAWMRQSNLPEMKIILTDYPETSEGVFIYD